MRDGNLISVIFHTMNYKNNPEERKKIKEKCRTAIEFMTDLIIVTTMEMLGWSLTPVLSKAPHH